MLFEHFWRLTLRDVAEKETTMTPDAPFSKCLRPSPLFASHERARGGSEFSSFGTEKREEEDASVRLQVVRFLEEWIFEGILPSCHPLCPTASVRIAKNDDDDAACISCPPHECCQAVGRRQLLVAMLCAHAHCGHLAPHHLPTRAMQQMRAHPQSPV